MCAVNGIVIREEEDAFAKSEGSAVLYAYMYGELIGALDFSRTGEGIGVNTIFVKPDFRRRGVGTALVRYLEQHCLQHGLGRARTALFRKG